MSTRPSEEVVVAIQALIARSDLRSIEYHELSGRLSGVDFDSSDDIDLTMNLQMQHRCGADDFGFRLAGELTTEIGTINVIVAATYDYEGDVPTHRTLMGFGNEVAVMTLFPFFRESVHTISSKVFGKPIALQPLERGVVGYDLDDASDRPAYTSGPRG